MLYSKVCILLESYVERTRIDSNRSKRSQHKIPTDSELFRTFRAIVSTLRPKTGEEVAH